MNDLEVKQYLFDLQGYLVIENALNAAEIVALNDLLDHNEVPESGQQQRFGHAPSGSGFLQWGQPFCDLLDHDQIMPVLRFRLGDCFRLDRIYGMHMSAGMANGKLHSDYGATAPTSNAVPGHYYHSRDTEILNGFTVVAWNLADAGPQYGGFCCIPGSHKSNFKLPQQISDAPDETPCVIIPPAPAGSVILFTEALTHGTAAWRGQHQRRSLLYKYCVSQMAWTAKRVQPPTNAALTSRQQILFNEPADPHRHFPSLFADPD